MNAQILRGGRLSEAAITVSRDAKLAIDAIRPDDTLGVWFPRASARRYRPAAGRDSFYDLYMARTSEDQGPLHYVIYQCHHAMAFLKS